MTLHFAYGSNMSRALMRRRCPGARGLGPARLEGWRYIITRDGYASLEIFLWSPERELVAYGTQMMFFVFPDGPPPPELRTPRT